MLKRSGAWFYYGDMRLAQGRDNTKQLFEDNAELANEVETKIVAAMTATEEAKNAPKSAPATDPAVPQATPKRKKVNIDIAVDD